MTRLRTEALAEAVLQPTHTWVPAAGRARASVALNFDGGRGYDHRLPGSAARAHAGDGYGARMSRRTELATATPPPAFVARRQCPACRFPIGVTEHDQVVGAMTCPVCAERTAIAVEEAPAAEPAPATQPGEGGKKN